MQVSYKTMNWGGEFQGGKNDMVTFQFQKPPGEFDGRIRYAKVFIHGILNSGGYSIISKGKNHPQ